MQNINFRTVQVRIRTASFAILDKVVGILNKDPDYRLRIEEHTDADGDSDRNLQPVGVTSSQKASRRIGLPPQVLGKPDLLQIMKQGQESAEIDV